MFSASFRYTASSRKRAYWRCGRLDTRFYPRRTAYTAPMPHPCHFCDWKHRYGTYRQAPFPAVIITHNPVRSDGLQPVTEVGGTGSLAAPSPQLRAASSVHRKNSRTPTIRTRNYSMRAVQSMPCRLGRTLYSRATSLRHRNRDAALPKTRFQSDAHPARGLR